MARSARHKRDLKRALKRNDMGHQRIYKAIVPKLHRKAMLRGM